MTTPQSRDDGLHHGLTRISTWGAALGLASMTAGLAMVAPATTIATLAVGMTLGMACTWIWLTRQGMQIRPEVDTPSPSITAAATSLRAVLHHCEDAIVLTDGSFRICYANDAFGLLCGRTIDAASGTTILEAVVHHIADGPAFARSLDELALHVDHEASGELTHLGTPARCFEWRSMALRDAAGSPCGRGFVFHDRSQAQELAGLKSDFLSTVTHELRTPLTSVKGSLQLVLGKSTALSAIDSELLNISLKNADRLIRLINDLLDISRLELGKIELTFGRVCTESLLEEAVAGLRAYAAQRDITIERQIDLVVPALHGDRDRLIQVLTNLISNAVKFSPPHGRVQVSAEHHGEEVAIAVQDWGIGIPSADQSRLFQRFQRLNQGRSDEPGTGLGLAISKAIVERHGGRIAVTSQDQAGSTFTIFVPAVQDEAAAHTMRRPVPTGDSDLRPTVLVVDDDQDLTVELERAWEGRYALTAIRRGLDAIDVAHQRQPDVVLLDVVLPDLSGYDVLRILRTTKATSAIPVIMLTVQPERALAMSLGACDVIGKPLDLDQLTRAVDQVLRQRPSEVVERRAASR